MSRYVLLWSHFPNLEVSRLPPCSALCRCPACKMAEELLPSHSPLSFLSCSATDLTKQLKLELGVLASGERGMRSDEKLPVDSPLFPLADTLTLEENGKKWVPSISYLRTDICSSSRQGDLCHSGFTPVNQHGVDL